VNEVEPLHRLFGLSWIDFFQGTSVTVETEQDLSLKQQFLDVVIIRKGLEPLPRRLPDGFGDLAPHNLVTFKSHHEALDCWAVQELVGHYVNYRKQTSPSLQDLLPDSDYRLFAVCARYPQAFAEHAPFEFLQSGVYEAAGFGLRITIIVVSQLPREEQNAMLHLFSAREELVRYGREHYRPHSQESSSLLLRLFQLYGEEADMPDKLKEFVRETIDELLATLPAEDRLKGLPAEERLKGLSAEELIKALPPETLEALARKLKANGSSAKP
jgi:hypothetical protein